MPTLNEISRSELLHSIGRTKTILLRIVKILDEEKVIDQDCKQKLQEAVNECLLSMPLISRYDGPLNARGKPRRMTEPEDLATNLPQWKSLNDVFAEGSLEVWYMKPDHFREGISGGKPDPDNLEGTHTLLGSIAPCPNGEYLEDDLDAVYVKLQSDFWSPNGEAHTLICSKGLRHTSMSMGDCFRLNGEVHLVSLDGFEKL